MLFVLVRIMNVAGRAPKVEARSVHQELEKSRSGCRSNNGIESIRFLPKYGMYSILRHMPN